MTYYKCQSDPGQYDLDFGVKMTYTIIKGGVNMTHFSGPYYVHDNKLYREVKMTPKGYHLRNKQNKLVWITLQQILAIIDNKGKK